MSKPLHQHDCDQCIFLYSKNNVDHWYHPPIRYPWPSWIQRYSSYGPDYNAADLPKTEKEAEIAERLGLQMNRHYRVYLYVYALGYDYGLWIHEVSKLLYSGSEQEAKKEACRMEKDKAPYTEAVTIGKVVRLDISPTQRLDFASDKYHRNHFTETVSMKQRAEWIPENPQELAQ